MDIHNLIEWIKSDIDRGGAYDRYPVRFFSIMEFLQLSQNIIVQTANILYSGKIRGELNIKCFDAFQKLYDKALLYALISAVGKFEHRWPLPCGRMWTGCIHPAVDSGLTKS